MKYILYQRCQIPVPFDALVREVRMQSQAHQEEAADTPPPQDMVSRKKEILKQKLRRKRQQWLNKAEKFLQNFNSIKESICNELKSGAVQGLNIILGSSVMTGREIFFIRLPDSFSTQSSTQLPRGQQTGVQLFRTLVTNEALLKVMNRPCGVQRIWVMMQKSCSSQPDTQTTTARGNDSPATSLIPRPEYFQNHRATVVEINVQHSRLTASMDLTPTVGSGITLQCNTLHKLGIKRSLYLNSPSIPQFYSGNQDSMHSTFQEYKESDSGVMALKDYGKNNMFPISLIRNSESAYNRPILETPVKIFKEDIIPIVETPVHSSVLKMESFTPSKQLASQLGTFNLSDSPSDTHWYQIDCMMSGFRDICMRS